MSVHEWSITSQYSANSSFTIITYDDLYIYFQEYHKEELIKGNLRFCWNAH